MDEHRQACLAAGMNDHIAKPIDAGELKIILSQWLELREAASGSQAQTPPLLPDSLPGLEIAAGVKRIGDDAALYYNFLLDFPKWTSGKDDEIRQALAAGDVKEAEKLAHTLRGTASSIFANKVAEAATTLEKTLAKGEDGPFDELVDRIEASLNEAHASIASLGLSEQAAPMEIHDGDRMP